ncbi:hypothetical protein [Paenibacillus gansuensis]|uniref:Uncharacterized protein n=1 Tax=Paenibacillus gansuensis TaxID=306542 RepID=A0ABW5PJD7_9BACL
MQEKPASQKRIFAGSVVKVLWGIRQGKYGIVLYSHKSRGMWVYKVKYSGRPGFTYETGKCYEYADDLQLVSRPSIFKKILRHWRKGLHTAGQLTLAIGQTYLWLHTYPVACWLFVGIYLTFGLTILISSIQRIMWGDLFYSGL